jgi:hypothetical protein
MNSIKKAAMYEFTLVNYESTKPYRQVQKIVFLTEDEALELNKALATNHASERYVRLDRRTFKEE